MKIELEISEPIDFGSGDHQYLVRKAGDDSSKPNKPYKASASAVPKQSSAKPRPKTGEPANSYVVEISEETNTENNSVDPFSDTAIRRAFIIKVFLILSAQLVITGMIISIFIFWKDLRVWVHNNPWFTYTLLPAFFVVLILLACCGDLRRQVPANYILLSLFTILEGLLLGTVSVFYEAEEVLWATAATAMVTFLLTLFAVQTKWDFTVLSGVLFVVVFVLIIFGLLIIFIRSYWLRLVYAALGTVVFSVYLVVDVQLMVGGRHRHSQLDPEEYVFAALNIYMDVINIFIFILQLFGLGQ
ncbi:protein lifeguard 1 isoform X1 [Erinaceus europaeus]|uniref:Protein lifeguard 1 isoform X1 n=1 Tax=Erinaceus europaeus TaxID=9365 RepID=A0ABM3XS94_ERIEU|nr:protein lifeguard 1 isoform X1 [Erinaceus europaeus]XP_060051686.1 protein lifeguard 1 isoform X1 [Erinaceus europaeus]